MMLKLHLFNGKIIWVDQTKAKILQNAGKVCCILQEYEDNMLLFQIKKQPSIKQPLKWALDEY